MRFRITYMSGGDAVGVSYAMDLAGVRRVLREDQKDFPDFLRLNDIWVVDTRTGTEYSVGQNFQLVEM